MKVSVCVTTYNEERSIRLLLDSLLEQTKKPSEIIIIDAGSKDQTVQLIRHYQKKDKRIKLQVEEGLSRAKGRNLAVEMSEYEVIAMTDAGCIAESEWLEKITEPFQNKEVDIVAGFYKMTGKTSLQKAFSAFLGVLPDKFSSNFLPSTRSIAFRKSAFEEIGGFSEKLDDTAEDTRFNYDAKKLGLRFAHVKNARVDWEMPEIFNQGLRKLYNYSLGDIKSGIWFDPSKGLSTHNIKLLFKVVRIMFASLLMIFGLSNPVLILILFILFFTYCGWSFFKVYTKTNDFKSGLWGIPIQLASDFVVIQSLLDEYLIKKFRKSR